MYFTIAVSAICFGQTNQTSSLTIQTYYPAPTGVYTNLRLKPSDEPTGTHKRHGTMYFDNSINMMRYYNKTDEWVNLTAGSGGSYWVLNDSTKVLKNINTGKVIIDGEADWDSDDPPGALWLNGEMKILGNNGNSTLYMGRSGSSYNGTPEIIFFTETNPGDSWALASERGYLGSHNSTLILAPCELSDPTDTAIALSVNEKGYLGIRYDKNYSFWDAAAPLHLVGIHDGSDTWANELFEFDADGNAGFDIFAASNNTTMGPVVNFNRARGTLASKQRVQDDDNLMLLMPAGWFPGGWHKNVGSIGINPSSTFNATSNPTHMEFYTTNTTVEDFKMRLIILETGFVGFNDWNQDYIFAVRARPEGGIWGYVNSTGGWSGTSDRRFKKNISGIEDALSKVLRAQGVRYDPVSDTSSIAKKGKHFGFIAQDLEKVLPELVNTNSDGFKGVLYDGITPVLVEAIKDQQKQIESLRRETEALKARKKQGKI